MKLALVHEWLTNLAGSERVVAALHELWPAAPIHTSLYAPEALPPEFGPDQMQVITSFLQRIPGAAGRWRWLLPLMPLAFERFDLSDFDVVVSSSHACAKGVLTRTETCHISYCYTPIRYAWELPHEYLAEAPPALRALLAVVMCRLRLWDQAAANRVDRFVAISEVVRRRIAKHYRRQAEVIYPPVATDRFDPSQPREDYLLCVSRLVGYKRVHLAAAACARLGLPLRIVGRGPDEELVRRFAAGGPVEFLGYQDDATVAELYGRARGFIFPGEEDFGITPVEAQAAGCPVLALGRGGATETVIDGETGLFFDEPTADSLAEALGRFGAREWSAQRCRANAERFDTTVFKRRLAEFVDQAAAEHFDRLDAEVR